ncbi:MAG: DNA-protecting protein DprA [Chloroflexi bacterium]|nr:DNA-protecting protein DprA [Chloroflexota bacterium]
MYWLALNSVKGVGAVRFRSLLAHFGSAQAAWEAAPAALRASGLPERAVQNLTKLRADVDPHSLWAELDRHGVRLLTWDDPGYPRRLREIDQPPPVLYVRGALAERDEWAVAIVGTRRVTAYGRQVAEETAAFLAHNGVTVVSGLARGIDSIAHAAALKAGGRSLAVLGSGADQVYPPENRKLAADMMENGALLSDYPLGTQPEAVNFPPRNRIIAGLSLAVVVAEAGLKSGALITAQFAADQGREVFAVPGNIYAPQSEGANHLLRQGAQPFTRPEDLLESLNLTLATEHMAARSVLPADAVEASLFALLGAEPVHMDELGLQAGLPIEKVSATLALMELKGLVRQVGGMHYVAVREAQARYLVDEED